MAKASAAKPGAIGAIDYLAQPDKFPLGPVCAVAGDEAFLKREVLKTVRCLVLGGDRDFSLSTFEGDAAELRDVLDALATATLFGGERRLVIVEEADSFVSEHRSELETYVQQPAKGSVLLLEVKTWPSNTRLAKAVIASGLAIECKSPSEAQIKRWLIQRATAEYGIRLEAAAADTLVEMLPPELGILEQELAKLSLLVGKHGAIDTNVVRENVGGWRTRTTWDLVDAAADGRAAEALSQLHRLIAAGEKPHALLPQIGHALRQLATATRLIEMAESAGGRLSLRSALEQAGVPPFKLATAERQLRQLGRPRAKQLTSWLLAADLAMKGHNSADTRARLELERLIVRLSAAGSDRSRPTSPMSSR
ncbi:MAG TPA: DNA polymerase III subunit delta [Lacipirellulaceae bacterium]|jgi:DNA polymerase-3 subunit delta